MKYLITGGCGFVGSNLAAEVLSRNEELIVLDNLFRFGSSKNLDWLKSKGDFRFYPFDIRNLNDVETVILNEKPDVVFHLAGQVAMTTSIENPRLDFEINVVNEDGSIIVHITDLLSGETTIIEVGGIVGNGTVGG